MFSMGHLRLLQRFFNKYEFKAKHLLCCSDCEPLSLQELLQLADADSKRRRVTTRCAGQTAGWAASPSASHASSTLVPVCPRPTTHS